MDVEDEKEGQMNKSIENIKYSVFENIKKVNEFGREYWSARELSVVLDYSEFRKFKSVISKAKESCKNSDINDLDHIAQVGEMVDIGSGAKRSIIDYHLSRYACYLIVQNADPAKEVVAMGQTYFAYQTRKQEIAELDDYKKLKSDDEKRLYLRNEMKTHNTEEKLRKDKNSINSKQQANIVHEVIGQKVRKAIRDIGGTMPEDLPPEDSIKKLEKKQKKLKNETDK